MAKINLRNVTERDMDLLILEELVASTEFSEWFGSKAGIDTKATLETVARSVLTSTGESDLEVTYLCDQGRILLLVENKIDAIFQRNQAERYRQRGKDYRSQQKCYKFSTVVVAPESYTDAGTEFNFRITYEELRDWFVNAASGDSRSQYKVYLLDTAIRRGESGWTMVPHATTTAFWKKYWEIAGDKAPELNLPLPREKPAKSSFIRFKPHDLPRGVTLLHKVPYGKVDLQFSGHAKRVGEFSATYKSTLESEMTIALANKSLAIRMVVEPMTLDPTDSSVDEKIHTALRAATRLLSWYRQYFIERPQP